MELLNLYMTATTNEVSDIIMNYIAMCGISELDTIYYSSLKSPLKDAFEDK